MSTSVRYVFSLFTLMATAPICSTQHAAANSGDRGSSPSHDFDFLVGSWTVDHRKLVHRLAHDNRWQSFHGTCVMHTLLGGTANVDDNVLDVPGATYRAASLRAYDAATGNWSIWWLDSRNPDHLDAPVIGRFHEGVGTFYAEDTLEGRPILVRFIWSDITSNSAKWQQAFSPDHGKTWETNWIMEFRRVTTQQ